MWWFAVCCLLAGAALAVQVVTHVDGDHDPEWYDTDWHEGP